MRVWLLLAMVAGGWVCGVTGHARLLEPPGRSSLWRKGFPVEPNYNDNELNCGGYQNHWEQNGGKCGVCGDPWQGPRENEQPSGKYATNIISRRYQKRAIFTAEVQVTSDHRGYFEFRICKKTTNMIEVNQNCLNRTLLNVTYDGKVTTRFYTNGGNFVTYKVPVHLPAGLKCKHCVLQWKYHTGNSWGCDDEKCCVGCGAKQEEFYSCADISIKTSVSASPPSSPTSPKATVPSNPTVTKTSNGHTTSTVAATSKTPTNTTTAPKNDATTPVSSGNICTGRKPWADILLVSAWCYINCRTGYSCPSQYCACSEDVTPPSYKGVDKLQGTDHVCYAVGDWINTGGMHTWCNRNCPCKSNRCNWCLKSMCECLKMTDR